MIWNIGLVGESSVPCDAEDLKEAIRQFSLKRTLPQNGYLIIAAKGVREFQLVIRSGTILHNGEALFGDPGLLLSSETNSVSMTPAQSQDEATLNTADASTRFPALAIMFFILAGLSLLGGLVMCISLWPGGADIEKSWTAAHFVPSITWLTIGIVQFALLTAIGQGLFYLKQIVVNTSGKKTKGR